MLALGDRVFAYRYEGYWRDVGTVQTYWEANMDLLRKDSALNLSDPRWSIYTRGEERPPSIVYPDAVVSNSLVADGCVIDGRVERSVLSPGVRVRAGAVVRDAIIFSDCEIGPGAIVERAILDKNVVVGARAHIGCLSSEIEDSPTLIGKNARLPAALRVDRPCVIGSDF
jgi:glucose-1-phosphate adenylyltransferase